MCGRFTLYANPKEVIRQFNLNGVLNYIPSYNIAPSQNVLVVCELPDHQRVITPMRWGANSILVKIKRKNTA